MKKSLRDDFSGDINKNENGHFSYYNKKSKNEFKYKGFKKKLRLMRRLQYGDEEVSESSSETS